MIMTMDRMHFLERAVIGAVLLIVMLLAWTHLFMQGSAAGMADMMPIPAPADMGLEMLVVTILMWTVMMAAMMLPGATPMILTYARVHQGRQRSGRASMPTWLFVAGYLAVWTAFATIAALAQWGLHENALLSSAMGRVGPWLGGGVLIAAGAFQFSQLKQACLGRCRSPLGFLMTEWREGPGGAVIMGIRHGAFCTGCCWALMLLMFVGGVMSLTWMAGLALYFLAEKLLPGMEAITRVTGGLLIAAGVVVALIH